MMAAVFGRDLGLDVVRVEVERLVDLGEDRRRAGIDDRRDRGHIGEARDDDLVAGADPEAEQRDPQGGRATAVQGEAVPHAREPGDLLLDVVDLRPKAGLSDGP